MVFRKKTSSYIIQFRIAPEMDFSKHVTSNESFFVQLIWKAKEQVLDQVRFASKQFFQSNQRGVHATTLDGQQVHPWLLPSLDKWLWEYAFWLQSLT